MKILVSSAMHTTSAGKNLVTYMNNPNLGICIICYWQYQDAKLREDVNIITSGSAAGSLGDYVIKTAKLHIKPTDVVIAICTRKNKK